MGQTDVSLHQAGRALKLPKGSRNPREGAPLRRGDSAEQEPAGRGIHLGTATDTGDAAADAPLPPRCHLPTVT